MTIKVVIDTNFLLIPVKFHIDIFSEISRLLCNCGNYELVIMGGTLKELENLKEGKVALEILNSQKQRYKISIYEPKYECKVDDSILKFALEENENCIICTNDRDLKRTLRKHNIPIITLKHNSKIDFE